MSASSNVLQMILTDNVIFIFVLSTHYAIVADY